MKTKLRLSLAFIILGFLLSSIIRVKFSILNGLEFHNFWFTPIPSIFDFAMISSSDLALTTTFLGYLFFAIAGLLIAAKTKPIKNKDFKLNLFLLLTFSCLIFELSSIFQEINSNFNGKHIRVGVILFIIGLYIMVINHRNLTKKYER